MSAEELGTLLGISEASAYDLIAKGHFERIEVLGKMRISNESFWKWYATQSIYRTLEDQAKDSEKMESTLRMPEIARMLGIHRNQVYDIVKRANLETIQIGRYKCVTKDSFYHWYENQSQDSRTMTVPEGVDADLFRASFFCELVGKETRKKINIKKKTRLQVSS